MVVRMSASEFDISLDVRETKVLCKDDSFPLYDHIETDDLWPHKDKKCHCVDVQHVTSFRLKFVVFKNDAAFEKMNIYIAYKPRNGFDVKCMVLTAGCYRLKYAEQEFYHGWKYLTTIPSNINASKLSLNLYKDRPVKYVSPSISALKLSLSDDLSQLFMDGTYSDVTVTSEDGATIKAHRCILAKRSEVFRAALEHNETTDKITTHLNKGTLRQIMTYIYTDKTPKRGDITADLFMAADFYHLSVLKHACIAAFYCQLNVENAIATLELAEKHSLTDLLEFTLKFVKKNWDSIVVTEDWYNMKSADLIKIIYKYFADDSLEYEL